MKKILISLLVLVVVLCTVVACQGNKQPSDTTSNEETTIYQPEDTDFNTEETDPESEPTDTKEPDVTETDGEDTTVSDQETEHPTETESQSEQETEPVDPMAPVEIIDANKIAENANMAMSPTHNNSINSAELMTENDRTFVRLTTSGDDPYVVVVNLNSHLQVPNFMLIRYRTNSESNGELYIGSGSGWSGNGDVCQLDWNGNGEWNYLVLNLNAVGLTSIQNGKIAYARLDFFTDAGAEGNYFDIEYIGYFQTAEYAKYYATGIFEYPDWDENKDVVVWHGLDELNHIIGGAEVEYEFTPGNSNEWDGVVNVKPSVEFLKYWGCVGYIGKLGQFGYQIDDQEIVFDDKFTVEAEEGIVVHAIVIFNADGASRLNIQIPLEGLTGEHVVRTFYKSSEGDIVELNQFPVIVAESGGDENDPENIPMWDEKSNIVVWHGFDRLSHFMGGAEVGNEGNSNEWDGVVDVESSIEFLQYWGYLGYLGTMGQFGYQVDDQEIVFDDNFTVEAEEGIVVHAIVIFKADGASRLNIKIPLEGLAGEHIVRIFYKNSGGTIVKLNQFPVIVSVPGGEENNPENIPMWDEKSNIVVWHGFDELNHMANGAIVGNAFTPGQASGWNNHTDVAANVDTLRYWGCVGYKGAFGQFGYQIDDNDPVFDDSFTVEAEDGIVVHAVVIYSADGAYRMQIMIPVAELQGEHTVRVLYKNAAGSMVKLNEFVVEAPVAEEPEEPQGYPMWDEKSDIIVWHGFDELNHVADGTIVGNAFTPGQASGWNNHTDVAANVDTLRYWGCVGYKGAFGQFGYQIDDNDPVFDDSFTVEAEDGIVVHAVVIYSADGAYRMQIMIPVAELQGEHTVRVLYKNAAGSMVKLNEFVVVAP